MRALPRMRGKSWLDRRLRRAWRARPQYAGGMCVRPVTAIVDDPAARQQLFDGFLASLGEPSQPLSGNSLTGDELVKADRQLRKMYLGDQEKDDEHT